ncbi:hypothetical protein ACQBAR_11225 [Propionibacteriaceae bacterium Y1685]|uniref:hypothetical protein n=1 Tax=Microlunatus sp. Y1700 TaxID=3418487 RepID=UPI003B76C855
MSTLTRLVLSVAAALLIIGGATTIVVAVAARSDQVTCDNQPMAPGDQCRVERGNGTVISRDLAQQADAQDLLPTIGPWVGAMAVLAGLVLIGAVVADGVRRPGGAPRLLGADRAQPTEEQWWETQQDRQRSGQWGRRSG